jgi:Na+-transporting NADH:ubiquinone oxidoreductase subunit B
MYNTGFQANYAIAHGAAALANWQTSWLFQMLGFGFDPTSVLACMLHGAIYFLPVYLP